MPAAPRPWSMGTQWEKPFYHSRNPTGIPTSQRLGLNCCTPHNLEKLHKPQPRPQSESPLDPLLKEIFERFSRFLHSSYLATWALNGARGVDLFFSP
jgi:hypothetical protein